MENKPINYLDILERVIKKGGLMASCAKMHLNDEKLATRFIMELSENCHSEHFNGFLGKDLVNDIKEFTLNACQSTI